MVDRRLGYCLLVHGFQEDTEGVEGLGEGSARVLQCR